jgi:hypothetical protein
MRQALHPVDKRWSREYLTSPREAPQMRKIAWRDHVESCHVRKDRRHREPLRDFRITDEIRQLVRQDVEKKDMSK